MSTFQSLFSSDNLSYWSDTDDGKKYWYIVGCNVYIESLSFVEGQKEVYNTL